MKEILGFLKQLASHNDREWFNANRADYDAVRAKVVEITENLIAAVAEVEPDANKLRVSDCTYRIYRDTRFSTDKTPYKTHIGIFVNPPYGKKSLRLGYYLHIEPGNSMFAVGTIGHPAPLLKQIRRDIAANLDEYRGIVDDEAFRSLYPVIGDDPVKTAPKGFSADDPATPYVKPRNYVCSAPMTDSELSRKNLIDRLRPLIIQGKRFNDFINYSVDEYLAVGNG